MIVENLVYADRPVPGSVRREVESRSVPGYAVKTLMSKDSETTPHAMALRGIHETVSEQLRREYPSASGVRVLDIGAGQGALTKRLYESGYEVSACDVNVDDYRYDSVPCRRVDVSSGLPYAAGAFDVVLAVELIEHLVDQERFLLECARVLRPGGRLLLSTPNILSLKSRLQFFASGYHWSFDRLDMSDQSGLQHITGRSVDQYEYIAHRCGFVLRHVNADKHQSTSRNLLVLFPIMAACARLMNKDFRTLNTIKNMLARVLILTFEKTETP